MLTYSFDDAGSSTLYEHLYQCIKHDILSGIIPPGEKLPSKRSFAKNLSVSTITIENAYGMLLDEGYIYSIPKKRLLCIRHNVFTPFFSSGEQYAAFFSAFCRNRKQNW